jgi:hypothetical protein
MARSPTKPIPRKAYPAPSSTRPLGASNIKSDAAPSGCSSRSRAHRAPDMADIVTPRRAERFGPWLPRPNEFPRPVVDRAALLTLGEPLELPSLDQVPDAMVASAIARALDETEPAPRELIRRIGLSRGTAFLRARYAKTRRVEAEGGLRLATHGRRRTPGGCFFVQCRDRMELEAYETLWSLACLAVGLIPRSFAPAEKP